MADSIAPKDPAEVTVVNEDPVSVHVTNPIPVTVSIANQLPPLPPQQLKNYAPPVATEEEGLVSAGQRAINLIWETTQMKIALSVIWTSLVVSAGLAIFGKTLGTPDVQLAAVVFLFGVANLVTGFYFGRTNHTKVGGAVGTPPAGPQAPQAPQQER